MIAEDEEFGSQGRRPDLVLANLQANFYKIVDVAVPFEGGKGSLAKARRKKMTHYARLVTETRAIPGFTSVETVSIVVGARGAWDSANEKLLKAIAPRRLPAHTSPQDGLRRHQRLPRSLQIPRELRRHGRRATSTPSLAEPTAANHHKPITATLPSTTAIRRCPSCRSAPYSLVCMGAQPV